MENKLAKSLSATLAAQMTPSVMEALVRNIDWQAFTKNFNPTMSVQEVADFLQRPYSTVAEWLRKGHLKAVKNGNSHPRVLLSDLQDFCMKSSLKCEMCGGRMCPIPGSDVWECEKKKSENDGHTSVNRNAK
jgi:excisionase family DNA binding protein